MMEVSCASPRRQRLSQPGPLQTSACGPSGDQSPSSSPPPAEGKRGSGVKKHHHKHNLKHRYELLETLGRGTYGKVKKAIERHSGREVSMLCLLLTYFFFILSVVGS